MNGVRLKVARQIVFLGSSLIVLGVGLYGTWLQWASARIWRPLDVPISLSSGHVHISEFTINTQSNYRIAFMAREGFGHQADDRAEYQYCLPALGTSWSLSSHGQVVAAGAETPCGDWLGGFQAGSGSYELDVDVSRDGSAFNSRKPRLVVLEDGRLQEAVYSWSTLISGACLVLVTLGAGILAFSIISIRNQNREAAF
jgi:hypothetical protein